MAVLLSFVKATDLEGTDISGSITVEPKSIDTSIPGPVNVTYSVTDKLGNTSTRTVSVLVGTDWYTFPLGNGWVLGDFTYEGNKVNGFTEQGLAKVSTVKDLILPHINPADGMTVIDTVGANAVDASSFRLKQLTSVADYANNIRRIDGRYSATSAGERDPGAFSNNLVNTIDLPNLEYVGREGFSRNRLTAVSFPNLKFLGSTAFGYNQITNIDFPKVEFVDVWGLGNNQITEVIMPSLQTIDNAGFINNQIASISLPELTTIMSNALANNKLPKLEQADIPKLTVIGDGSFRNNLISYLDLPNITEIQARGLQNNVLASTAPAGLSSLRVIGIQAFQNNQIVELAIPNLASVGTLAFDINPGSPTYSNNVVIWTENNQVPSLENYLVNPSQDALVLTWLEEDFVWDANDTGRILGFSSSGKQKLPDMAYAVSFPDRATSIAPRAFFSLKLTSVTGKNVTDLGNSAFEQNSISSAVFPNLQTIGSSAFRNNQLTEFDFSHVVSVGSNAFRTNKLTSVDLPLVTDIGDGAFMSNTIKDLSAENVINIASQAFASQPIESLFLPKVKTIGNSAFSGGKLLKTVDLPVVESIGVSAFADNIINSLSLPQVKTLGNTAFNTNRLTSIDLPMIETLGTQAFRYNRLVEAYLPLSLTNLPNNTFELNRTYNGLNREVMVFFPGGENPNNLQDGFINNVRQHIVNPTKVTIHYVDEAGNPLAESITEYIFAEKTYPAINIFNYKENKLSITVPDNRKPNEEFFVYEKLALEGMHTNGVEIYQLNEIDRNTTLPKTRYYIGDKMITRVYADLTGFNAAINNGKINIYYDPAFIEPSSIKIPTSTSIKSFKVNNGVIEVLLNPIAGSYNLEIPIEWRFKKYVTPDNYQMEINALFAAGDTVYSVAEPIYLEGYYNKPMMTKRSPLNIPDNDYGYSNSATNGPRLMGEMSLAKLADNTYDYSVSNAYPVEFSFGINNLERYVSEAIVTDTLPTYIALDANGNEEIRTAVFDYDLNPGWILSNDGKTVTQHAIFAKTLFPGSSIKPLYLTFPGLKSGYNVMNNVQVELIPDKIGLKEKSMFVQDDISIYAFKFEPVKYEGDPRFDKDDNKAPWYNGGMAYFYDVQADREKIIPFFLRTSSMATLTDLVDLRITDYALDDRLYYYGLSFPQGAGATGNLPVTIVAYSQVGAIMQPSSDPILQSVTTTMNTSNHVVFDAGIAKNIDYIQIILPASHKVFSALEFVVETKLREPDKTHYTPSPLSGNNVFHNHAVMSGNLYLKGTMVDASVRTEPLIGSGGLVISEYTTAWDGIAGNYLWHEQAFVTIRDYAVDMGVGKTQTYPSTENVYPGQEGSYSLRVRPFVSGSTDEFEGMSVIREKLHDFEMVDLLPNGLSVTKITLSDGFKASEESSYRIVENYGGSGQRAIVFTAKKLNEGVFNIATIDTIVDPETEEGQVTNQVFLTFENPSVRKVGNKLSPPGEGGDGRVWIQDQKVFNLLKVKALFARKYITKTGDLAWSPIGIQTESEGSFDYRLSLINNLDQPRSKIDIVDFFPYLGDVSIQEANIGTGVRPPRESKFMNTFDTNRDVIVPNGYTVSYWNSNTPPVYPASGNRSADAYIASLTWSSSPAANTRGIRITATEGVVLEPGMRLDVIVPMLAPVNTVDNDFNLTGLRAYNTFVRKDDFAIRFLEPNRVYNEIPAPLGSITFTKWAQDSVVIDEATQYQLQGAEFELRDKEGNFVAKAVSDADGKVKFVDLPILNTYTIKETKAPQGFTLSTKIFSVNYEAFKAVYDRANETFDVVLSDRVSKDNFLNIKPFYGTYSLEKVNERGEHLAYIRFNITGLDEWNKTYNQNFLTGTNGLISITQLLEGRYLLTELSSSNDSGFVAIEPIEFAITKDAPDVKFLKENGKEIVNQNLRVLINKLAVGSDFDIDASIRDLTDFGLKKLDGYSFIITDTSDNSTITTGPTVNGRVAIEGLKIDTVYTISEVKKDGTIYAYNASQYRFKINSLGKIVDEAGLPFRQNMLHFPNREKPVRGEVTVIKNDAFGKALAGAVFGLFKNNELIAEATSELVTVNGALQAKAVFTDIEAGSYVLKELAAPDGYVCSLNEYTFIVPYRATDEILTNPNYEVSETAVIRMFDRVYSNKRINVEIIKGDEILTNVPLGQAIAFVNEHEGHAYRVSGGGFANVYKALEGAVFELFELDGAVKASLGKFTSNAQGSFDFTEVLFKESGRYTFEEITPPANYRLDPRPITINLAFETQLANFTGTVTRYKNNQPIKGRVIISKYDEDARRVLAGVTFGLFSADDITFENPLQSKVTNASGIVEFRALELGNYLVKETAVPDGFQLLDIVREVHISQEQTSFNFVIKNPRLVQVPVEKRWLGDALEQVIVALKANGETAVDNNGNEVEAVVLNVANEWKTVFSNLPKYDAEGLAIVYTVLEEAIEGYKVSYSGSFETGFVITNEKEPPSETTTTEPSKPTKPSETTKPTEPSEPEETTTDAEETTLTTTTSTEVTTTTGTPSKPNETSKTAVPRTGESTSRQVVLAALLLVLGLLLVQFKRKRR